MIKILTALIFLAVAVLPASGQEPYDGSQNLRIESVRVVYEIEGGVYDGHRGFPFRLWHSETDAISFEDVPGVLDSGVIALVSLAIPRSDDTFSFEGREELGETMFVGQQEVLNPTTTKDLADRPLNLVAVVPPGIVRIEWRIGEDVAIANLAGTVTESLNINQLPDTLGYSDEIALLAGESDVSVLPEFTDEFSDFSVQPELPAGLNLDTVTGEISGQAPADTYYSQMFEFSAGGVSQEVFLSANSSISEIDLEPSGNYELVLDGVNESGLNPTEINLSISIVGDGAFDVDADRSIDPVGLKINGAQIQQSDIALNENAIQAPISLFEGDSLIEFSFYDDLGRTVSLNKTVYAGDNDFLVNLVDEDGAPFLSDDTEITITLADNPEISVVRVSSSSQISFSSIPARTILIKAVTQEGQIGFGAAFGGDSSANLTIPRFGVVSDVDNNDIALGLEGWEFSSPNAVDVVPHDESQGLGGLLENVEESVPDLATETRPDSRPQGEDENETLTREEKEKIYYERRKLKSRKWGAVSNRGAASNNDSGPDNNDIRLTTLGEGQQSLTRNFVTETGTSSVTIRYRFVTSEVPGGFFGSEFNDSFSVSITSPSEGTIAAEQSSMNALGLGAFDAATGATAWREMTINGDLSEKEIRSRVTVSNVADGAFDSSVEVDFILEKKGNVKPAISWNETSGGLDLNYEVVGEDPLAEDIPIEVYFATGTDANSVLGEAIFEFTVTEGVEPGEYGPERILISSLSNAPISSTHLVAVAGDNSGSISDVKINFGPNAVRSAVSSGMIDTIEDGLRQAGNASASISSTARGPEDQARAMFQNLTNANNSIADNIATQLATYRAPGRAVVIRFQTESEGFTPEEIRGAEQSRIRAAMVEEINEQGCINVSRHCEDPAIASVVDVPYSSFLGGANGGAGTRFQGEVSPRLRRLLVENRVFHLEYVN